MKIKALQIAALLCGLCSISYAADGEWISLFDGKSFDGWQVNENPDSWVMDDGAFKSQGDRAHLFYVGDVANHNFKNFEFYAEVKTEPGANSGIYIHTKFQEEGWPAAGYECQVINTTLPHDTGYVEHKMAGSIYAVRNTWVTPAKDNEWFEYRILVSGKTIQTYINGELICEYTENENPWRAEDKQERLLSTGTFAFQAHDPGSIVRYRGMKVRLLPDDAPSLTSPEIDAELDRLISKLSNDNIALIDIGIFAPSSNYQHNIKMAAHKYGLTLLGVSLSNSDTLQVIVETERKAIVKALTSAKAAGKKVVFDSQGAFEVDVAALKVRLQAIEESGLGWNDFWVPSE